LDFIKNTKWEDYVGDSTVQQHLGSIKERITAIQSQKKAETNNNSTTTTTKPANAEDLSNSARVKLGKKKLWISEWELWSLIYGN